MTDPSPTFTSFPLPLRSVRYSKAHEGTHLGYSSEEPEEEDILCSMCSDCGGTPCFWIELKDDVCNTVKESFNNAQEAAQNNNELRKAAYRAYVAERYGFLGAGRRMRLPDCVVAGIREMWPSPDNTYVGFHDKPEEQRNTAKDTTT